MNVTCEACKGIGRVLVEWLSVGGTERQEQDCIACGGTGEQVSRVEDAKRIAALEAEVASLKAKLVRLSDAANFAVLMLSTKNSGELKAAIAAASEVAT